MKAKQLTFSKAGIPCLWERGGGWSNTGEATLIADPAGGPKVPLFVRTRGPLACEDHALIPVRVGDLVVECSRWRRAFSLSVFRISRIEGGEAILTRINHHDSEFGWDSPLPPNLEGVVKAAKRKASTYHCRSAFWVHEKK